MEVLKTTFVAVYLKVMFVTIEELWVGQDGQSAATSADEGQLGGVADVQFALEGDFFLDPGKNEFFAMRGEVLFLELGSIVLHP
mgnify:CR=1 FL=1